jgi:hypothetical protein
LTKWSEALFILKSKILKRIEKKNVSRGFFSFVHKIECIHVGGANSGGQWSRTRTGGGGRTDNKVEVCVLTVKTSRVISLPATSRQVCVAQQNNQVGNYDVCINFICAHCCCYFVTTEKYSEPLILLVFVN